MEADADARRHTLSGIVDDFPAARADAAFSAFVRGRQAELVRLGWALTGDRQLGEDLAQAALQRLWPRWSRVEAAGEPLAYTRRIMVNLSVSWRRRRSWHAERTGAHQPDVHQPGTHRPGTANIPDADASGLVDSDDAIDRWLALLPARQRAVITLRFLLDLDVAETARLLGCSPGTVKSQTSKALTTLRAAVGAGPSLEPNRPEVHRDR